MRKAIGFALFGALCFGALGLGGCSYFPVPPDPIRIVDSPAEVFACRRIGAVGPPVRTAGNAPYFYGSLTAAVPARSPAASPLLGAYGVQPTSDNLAVSVNAMRDAALARGATDLLLSRRIYRDWSYVQGIAYRCRH